MSNPVQQAQELGQSVWCDYIRRDMFGSGELRRLLEAGITGMTSNPTIFEKAIVGSNDYDDALHDLIKQGKSAGDIYEALATEDIRSAADALRPHYDATKGKDGYISLEVSPHLAHDTQGSIAEARRLFKALDRPNAMIKIPATPEGIPAIRQLIGEGLNINVTLIFSVNVYRQVMEAYISGLEDLAHAGGDLSKSASVASFFVSRIDTEVDHRLDDRMKLGRNDLKPLLGQAAVANAKLAYQAFKVTFQGARFQALADKGARVQRPLWASTSTKNPSYSDLLYVETLIGPDTVNTMPPATIEAMLDHGRVEATVEKEVDHAKEVMEALADAGVDMEQVTEKLLKDGVAAFADSFDKLMSNLQQKRDTLAAQAARS